MFSILRYCPLIAVLVLSACVSAPAPRKSPVLTKPPVSRPIPQRPSTTVQQPVTDPSRAAGAAFSRPAPELVAEIKALWKAFPGKTGIAVRRIDGNWAFAERGDEYFPQQSVSKMWVAMALLDQIDRGIITPDTVVRIGQDDLTLFHQPIAARVNQAGFVEEPIGSLVETAVVTSDNTANDSVLRSIGGPNAVKSFLTSKNISDVRFGPGERLLQSQIAGISWTQAMSTGRGFEVERAKLPDWIRRKALESYVANPVDGATPLAMVNTLGRLARGELLSERSTRQMVSLLERVQSGPQRLKAGAPSGWRVAHKTGTGQVLEAMATGYNDVGIITAPDGTRYAVAVMLGSTTASVPERMALMQAVTRAIASWHNQ
jgi:beta-lactamase class A